MSAVPCQSSGYILLAVSDSKLKDAPSQDTRGRIPKKPAGKAKLRGLRILSISPSESDSPAPVGTRQRTLPRQDSSSSVGDGLLDEPMSVSRDQASSLHAKLPDHGRGIFNLANHLLYKPLESGAVGDIVRTECYHVMDGESKLSSTVRWMPKVYFVVETRPHRFSNGAPFGYPGKQCFVPRQL